MEKPLGDKVITEEQFVESLGLGENVEWFRKPRKIELAREYESEGKELLPGLRKYQWVCEAVNASRKEKSITHDEYGRGTSIYTSEVWYE